MPKKLIILVHPGALTDEPCYPSLDIMFLARFIQNEGYEVSIVDQRVEENWASRVFDRLHETLWIGFTVITGEKIIHALETSRRIKEASPNTPIVWGGWHPTFVPYSAVKEPAIDFVVPGIGELKIRELNKHIEKNGTGPINHPKILHKDGKEMYRLERENFPWLPGLPPYDLIDLEKYRSENNIAAIITSRGCPFKCHFCTIAKFSFIMRDEQSVIDEIEYLVRERGFTSIQFIDGLFFSNKKRVFKIIEGSRARDLDFKWRGSMRANTFNDYDDQDVARLIELGLTKVFFGAESGSQDMLARMRKKITVDDILHLSELTGRHNLELSASFLCGLPYERVVDLERTIEVIERMLEFNPNIRILNPFFRPFPGSEAYQEIVDLGWRVPDTLEDWANQRWNILPDEVEPFLWMDDQEFGRYMEVYRKSVLCNRRLMVLDRQ